MHLTGLQVPGFDVRAIRRQDVEAVAKALSDEAARAQQPWERSLKLERLGALLQAAGQPKAAARAFEDALQANGKSNTPATTRLSVLLGLALLSAGQHQQALGAWEDGINRLIDRALRIIHKEEKLLRADPADDGGTLLADPAVFGRMRELCRLDPTFAILRNNMAVVHAEHGDPGAARRFLREAMDFTPAQFVYQHPQLNLALLDAQSGGASRGSQG